MKTYITYNKGRDWRLLQAPDVDLRGSPVHCLLVSHPVSYGVHRKAGYSEKLPQGLFPLGVLGTCSVMGRDFLQHPGADLCTQTAMPLEWKVQLNIRGFY